MASFVPNTVLRAEDLNSAFAEKADAAATSSALDLKANSSDMNASLSQKADLIGGKVPTSQLPVAVLGALSYQGSWNAAINNPSIPVASAVNKGHYYVVNVAGTTTINDESDWQIGDWIVSNGNSWDKIDNTDRVTSVNGKSGAVNLTASDIGVKVVYLSGSTAAYVTQTKTYTITNHNSFSDYVVQVSAGSASISDDTITFAAPATPGPVTMTIIADDVAQEFIITVEPAAVAPPTITSPAFGATGVTETPTITTSAFAAIGASDTHLDTDWELWSGPKRTGTKLASLYASTTSKTAWTFSAGILLVDTTYYPAVRHRGATLGESEWATSSFTTAASFNKYIPTPAATPANFGAAFEGGFYAGMYWDQIAQSSSSKTLATGTQTFAVPDMTSAPIVYAGQSLEVRSRANPANKFIGTVTGAIGTTLTLNVTSIGGSGTFSDWSIMSRFRNIVAPKASGENAGIALKNANTAFPSGCQSLVNGWAATEAMRLAGNSTEYPAAHWARGLTIGGFNDWHIPARDVLELSWRTLKPTTTANYTNADRPTAQTFDYKRDGAYGDTANTHGLNNNSSPTGAAYTSSVPGQTAAAAFQTGGAEAYEFGSAYYWSSTEYDATVAWGQLWYSSGPGSQGNFNKTNTNRVRAVRRSII